MEPHLPAVLPLLHLWIDPIARDGPENMAVDEWLAETCTEPVLRSYRWKPGWGSFGYFVKAAELPEWGLRWVRRWTGGGIVDHRADWTYTLWVPNDFGLAEAKGGESYRVIHEALVAALRGAGVDARLSGIMPAAAGGECFLQPVEFDVLADDDRKIAGAGQRRSAHGLLHQGSVATEIPVPEGLASFLSRKVIPGEFAPDPAWLEERIRMRYGREEWNGRR